MPKPRDRANGEGSIYQTRAGIWLADLPLPDGRRKRRRAKPNTKAGARAALRALVEEREAGLLRRERVTVRAYLEDWLAVTVRPKVRPATLESYQQKLRVLVYPTLGARQLANLRPSDLRRLYARLQTEPRVLDDRVRPPLSSTTVRTLHVILRQALAQAEVDGLWGRGGRNPADLVSAPPKAEFEPAPFTLEQARTFLRSIAGHRHGPLWTLLLGTALRFGEATGLVWDDLIEERRILRVEFGITWPRGRAGRRRWQRGPLKTKRSKRLVVLPRFVLAALREQRARVAALRLRAGRVWQDHGFVFPSAHGEPLRENHVLEQFKAVLEQAQLDARRMHDLRATTSTLLFGEGARERAIADLLGHSIEGGPYAVTNRYLGTVPPVLYELADQLDRLLGDDPAAGQAQS